MSYRFFGIVLMSAILMTACQSHPATDGQGSSVSPSIQLSSSSAFSSEDLSEIFLSSNTTMLTTVWQNPWAAVHFYSNDCVSQPTISNDELNVLAKTVVGSGARVPKGFMNNGTCMLANGNMWVAAQFSMSDDNYPMRPYLLLLDPQRHVIQQIANAPCASSDLWMCKLLGMKDGNFFFQNSMGDAGGYESDIFASTASGDSVTLEKITILNDTDPSDDEGIDLKTATQTLQPILPSCTLQPLYSIQIQALEKAKSYGNPLTIRDGRLCDLHDVKIAYFTTDKGVDGIGVIDANGKASAYVATDIKPDIHFVQYKTHNKAYPKYVLATRHIDNEKHTYAVDRLVVEPGLTDYSPIMNGGSFSGTANPEACSKIHCIDSLPFVMNQ